MKKKTELREKGERLAKYEDYDIKSKYEMGEIDIKLARVVAEVFTCPFLIFSTKGNLTN